MVGATPHLLTASTQHADQQAGVRGALYHGVSDYLAALL